MSMTREEELKYLADYEYNQRALKELEQYRAIGTVEELKQTKGKMTAKSRIIKEGKYYCCTCERFAQTSGHCIHCGQLLY